ncbi:ParB/RepB/Spo0J family partition protein [Cereibacter sphaeroides]|jgi:ParB family chromosome partitioning protein|nr:ParB/RepB/Spo0J family partition protein [Cereibacter sphaeroides]AMJ48639.1 chromosome partitioning protein ParB [Cereibacter sphaeroides]ANS35354.1 chromosome partitioning protein ParB [Cereibacter sphaeroides]ATN64407.1 chromosome partitioning protein ParB [Cereibacter sphaeroides]QJC85378.1 ParB/RepB/Spo0J family partition protein [Cereibacter sphaeroides]GEM92114.1 chromosome segregation DNA-binding protein [Cereibacter sphaeroides]
MEKKMERRGLGRGLSALMADIQVEVDAGQGAARRPDLLVPVEKLMPNPNQPRRDFGPEALEDLAASIRQKGVIQPLIVRPMPDGDRYEIVAGERRWRASQLAQLHEVPVIVREFDDTEVLEVAIIENIQRADLNAIEEAMGYRQLMDRFGHTQEKLAEALSRSRSHIANLLRLLQLPDDVQAWLREGKLTAGHARALITTPNASDLARQVISRNLSVRDTERLARGAGEKRKPSAPRGGREKDADTRALEADLSANLKMAVTIDHEPGGENGRLTIRYNTLDDLDTLCRTLSVMPRDGSI